MARYYGLCANAHSGKVKKTDRVPLAQGMNEEGPPPISSNFEFLDTRPKQGYPHFVRDLDWSMCRSGST